MFNDYSNYVRDEFKFEYNGSQLYNFAKNKYFDFFHKERDAREKMASMLRDVKINTNNREMDALKQEIEFFGKEKEKCLVWTYEFSRRPEKEYYLKLSDVVYFGLTKEKEDSLEKEMLFSK